MKEMTAEQLNDLLKEGKTLNIIDVREVDEVANGMIPGATHIPLGLIEFRMQDLDKNNEYIVVCKAGGRSSRAGQYLESHGFNVINMTGGMDAWTGEIK
ncbi:rhodanese-like domain-containing protein [Bacillus sp. AFS041924]|uniref:rhodanese-like domain-containing protein n=1 Tax=Bacillus sp. AFS041924 TaxID=2033503 RepID=UPI000BFDA1E4|nr:rhodanese-like domain-containing protein [Bacillus sp. AFS041924]PGS50629.1 rhodanese [Bacillus sp. AFS041924]